MKKIFAQPEMMVVKVQKNDIITMSDPHESLGYGEFAPELRSFDSYNEGY